LIQENKPSYLVTPLTTHFFGASFLNSSNDFGKKSPSYTGPTGNTYSRYKKISDMTKNLTWIKVKV
jgi:hypothetical protein